MITEIEFMKTEVETLPPTIVYPALFKSRVDGTVYVQNNASKIATVIHSSNPKMPGWSYPTADFNSMISSGEVLYVPEKIRITFAPSV